MLFQMQRPRHGFNGVRRLGEAYERAFKLASVEANAATEHENLISKLH